MTPAEELEGMDEREALAAVKASPTSKYTRETLECLLERESSVYPQLFYHLSVSNQTIYEESYASTYLHRCLTSLSDEGLYYVCEGVKLQLARGSDDFYYIIHHFLSELEKKAPLQKLLVYLVENGDYRIREFLIVFDIIGRVFRMATERFEHRIFVVKFIKAVIKQDSAVLRNYIRENSLSVRIAVGDGCLGFFRQLIADNAGALACSIEIL